MRETKIRQGEVAKLFEYTKHYEGPGLDLCCCDRVYPNAVEVDVIPRGEKTLPWGRKSVADIQCDCSKLTFAPDESYPFVVAIHAFEHFEHPLEVMKEWFRVVKVGGVLGIICPDVRYTPRRGSRNHDDTHRSEMNPSEFELKILRPFLKEEPKASLQDFNTLQNRWSFECVIVKS